MGGEEKREEGGKKLKERQDQLIAKERKLDKKRNWGKKKTRQGGKELCIRQLIIPQSNHSFSLTVALSASRFCLRSFFSVFFFVTYL